MIDLYDDMIETAREYSWPGPYRSVMQWTDQTDIAWRNNQIAGQKLFQADTLRSWNYRISERVYGGRLFVSSKRNDMGNGYPRVYTIRIAGDDGVIDTVGELGQFGSLATAKRWAKRLAEEMMGEMR